MAVRTYEHALTGRQIRVAEGTRAAELVEADDNYSEVKSKSTSKKEASDGTRNAGGRRGGSRKKSDDDGK